MRRIDENGLDEMTSGYSSGDREVCGGRWAWGHWRWPVGRGTDTLEEVYEPYLIMEGYLSDATGTGCDGVELQKSWD